MRMNTKTILSLVGVVLALVAIFGLVAVLFESEQDSGETYRVIIRYETLDKNGNATLFKTYEKEHEAGEQVVIKAPEKKGYAPEKEQLATVVDSDIYMTVQYRCTHATFSATRWVNTENSHTSYRLCATCHAEVSNKATAAHAFGIKTVHSYPTPEAEGEYTETCAVCNYEHTVSFTKITQKVTFGGEELRAFKGQIGTGTQGKYYMMERGLVLWKQHAPELDCIFDGVEVDSANGIIGKGLSVSLDYDENIWGAAAPVFLDHIEYSNHGYSYIRFGDNYRVVYYHDQAADAFSTFLSRDDCPLITAPIEITITYDFTKDFTT